MDTWHLCADIYISYNKEFQMNRAVRYSVIFAIAFLFIMTLAGCDPITGKSLIVGSLRVINEHTSSCSNIRLYTEDNATGTVKWTSPSGQTIPGNNGQRTFTDIPPGKYSVKIGDEFVNDVSIVVKMTTTVTRQADGTLVAGVPLPLTN